VQQYLSGQWGFQHTTPEYIMEKDFDIGILAILHGNDEQVNAGPDCSTPQIRNDKHFLNPAFATGKI
jgi:hypothetical protein